MSDPASRILAGRTCLVTGASRGIGRATAVGLAVLGARVITASRGGGAGPREAAAIGVEARSSLVSHRPLDLASLADVERFAQGLAADVPRLDVLVNNASVITRRRVLTVDGIETQLAVNHVGPFLLTRLLLPLLARSASARIVNVASEAHRHGAIDWDDLQGEARYRPTLTYCRTKLANVLFTRELARRLAGEGTTANCLHPGVIRTELLAAFFPGPLVLQRLAANLFGTTPERGARTSVHVASSPDLAGVSGAYFVRCRERAPSLAARSDASAARLWAETERLLARR